MSILTQLKKENVYSICSTQKTLEMRAANEKIDVKQ